MPMLGVDMADAIKAAIEAESDKSFDQMWSTIATAIVDYIKANAVVNVTSVSGITVGGGVSGPGTGTLT